MGSLKSIYINHSPCEFAPILPPEGDSMSRDWWDGIIGWGEWFRKKELWVGGTGHTRPDGYGFNFFQILHEGGGVATVGEKPWSIQSGTSVKNDIRYLPEYLKWLISTHPNIHNNIRLYIFGLPEYANYQWLQYGVADAARHVHQTKSGAYWKYLCLLKNRNTFIPVPNKYIHIDDTFRLENAEGPRIYHYPSSGRTGNLVIDAFRGIKINLLPNPYNLKFRGNGVEEVTFPYYGDTWNGEGVWSRHSTFSAPYEFIKDLYDGVTPAYNKYKTLLGNIDNIAFRDMVSYIDFYYTYYYCISRGDYLNIFKDRLISLADEPNHMYKIFPLKGPAADRIPAIHLLKRGVPEPIFSDDIMIRRCFLALGFGDSEAMRCSQAIKQANIPTGPVINILNGGINAALGMPINMPTLELGATIIDAAKKWDYKPIEADCPILYLSRMRFDSPSSPYIYIMIGSNTELETNTLFHDAPPEYSPVLYRLGRVLESGGIITTEQEDYIKDELKKQEIINKLILVGGGVAGALILYNLLRR